MPSRRIEIATQRPAHGLRSRRGQARFAADFPTVFQGNVRRLCRAAYLSVALAVSALLAGFPAPARAERIRILIQSSPLAGSQYYAASQVWTQLAPGDALTLVREPGNRHDARAIRVEWRGQQLGYLPRAENGPVAAALDRGDRLVARIARLRDDPDPWRRVEVEVWAEF